MSEDAFDPESFQGIVPVFPLPNVVLFPRIALPLHIFEPRYRQMIQDALDGDRLIAMALLQPGWEPDYEGSPAFFPVVCVGRIVSEQSLDGGKYNILLYGVTRARVTEEPASGRPYRMVRVEGVTDDPEGLEEGRADEWRRRLSDLLKSIVPQIEKNPDLALGTLVDLAASVLVREAADRQRVLEETNVARRMHLLVELLAKEGPLAIRPGLDALKRQSPN
jgi:Lon protease-like protein